MESLLYVGMDVHKETLHIAVIKDSSHEPISVVKKKNDFSILKKYFLQIERKKERFYAVMKQVPVDLPCIDC